jgi:protein-tyrosine phosphatase
MTQIWERLFIGGIADAERLAVANPAGINTVVSLSETPVENKRRDINYFHLPIEDGEPVSVRQFYAVMDAIRKNIRWGTVLLHCAQGVSRAPSMAAAYMGVVGYRNLDASLKEIRRVRPFVCPSTELLESLRRHLG